MLVNKPVPPTPMRRAANILEIDAIHMTLLVRADVSPYGVTSPVHSAGGAPVLSGASVDGQPGNGS